MNIGKQELEDILSAQKRLVDYITSAEVIQPFATVLGWPVEVRDDGCFPITAELLLGNTLEDTKVYISFAGYGDTVPLWAFFDDGEWIRQMNAQNDIERKLAQENAQKLVARIEEHLEIHTQLGMTVDELDSALYYLKGIQ